MNLDVIVQTITDKQKFYREIGKSLKACQTDLHKFLQDFVRKYRLKWPLQGHKAYQTKEVQMQLKMLQNPTLVSWEKDEQAHRIYNIFKRYFYQEKGFQMFIEKKSYQENIFAISLFASQFYQSHPQIDQEWFSQQLIKFSLEQAVGQPEDVFSHVFMIAAAEDLLPNDSKSAERAFHVTYKDKANILLNGFCKPQTISQKFGSLISQKCSSFQDPQNIVKFAYMLAEGMAGCVVAGYDVLYPLQFQRVLQYAEQKVRMLGLESDNFDKLRYLLVQYKYFGKNYLQKISTVNKITKSIKDQFNENFGFSEVSEAVGMFAILCANILFRRKRFYEKIEYDNSYYLILTTMAKAFRVLYFSQSLIRVVLNTLQNQNFEALFKKEETQFTFRSYSFLHSKEEIAQQFQKYLKDFAIQPKHCFKLERLSEDCYKTRDIFLLISGFTSQNCQPSHLWKNVLSELKGEEVYSFKFKSKTTRQVVINVFKAIIQSYIGSDNVYQEAEDNAIQAAMFFSRLVPLIFPACRINIISFSLGTLVTQQILSRMIELKSQYIIGKVVLMGGVAQVKDVAKLAEIYEITNCWSQHDNILKYLLNNLKQKERRVGLQDVPNAKNFDLSEMNLGHLGYNQHYKKIVQKTQFNTFLTSNSIY